MEIYNVNFNNLIRWLVPPVERTAITLNWLKALISPISQLYNDFIRYRDDVNYRLGINSQVCYLEKAINDAFDKDLRRIYISDALNYLVKLIHQDDAQVKVLTYPEGSGNDDKIPVIHDVSAYENSGFDFNVHVPFQLTTAEEIRLKSLLNTYKLPSKKYKILYELN